MIDKLFGIFLFTMFLFGVYAMLVMAPDFAVSLEERCGTIDMNLYDRMCVDKDGVLHAIPKGE